MKIRHRADHRVARRAKYPPLEDLADAIVKAHGGDPSALAAYVAACNAVKATCPKSEPQPPEPQK